MSNAYKVFVGKPKVKRPLERFKIKVGNNIFLDWIYLAQDRVQWLALVKTVMNVWIARCAGNL